MSDRTLAPRRPAPEVAPTRSRPGLAVLIACALALPLAADGVDRATPPAEARGGEKAEPGKRLDPAKAANQRLGAAIFDQCVRWVAANTRGIAQTTDFHIGVLAELDLDTTRHRGPMRIWWKSPDKYRQELTTNGRTTTKILSGDFMWIVHPSARVQRMHGTSEGAGAIAQLKEDRSRMADLARFITLGSLRGNGVIFEFEGERKGSGSYAGQWLKIRRKARGAADMLFYIAYTKDAEGRYLAQYPGVVSIEGDPRRRIPTEDFILRDWVRSPAGQPHTYMYPRSIEAYSRVPKQRPVRFLKATVESIQINTGLPAARFSPPTPKGR